MMMKPKIILGAIIAGIKEIVKTTQDYNKEIKKIHRKPMDIYPDPCVEYLALHSPLTFNEAWHVYRIAQAYDFSAACIIDYAIQT